MLVKTRELYGEGKSRHVTTLGCDLRAGQSGRAVAMPRPDASPSNIDSLNDINLETLPIQHCLT